MIANAAHSLLFDSPAAELGVRKPTGFQNRMPLIDHQVKLLELEIQTINSSIRQMDEIAKNIKQWTVTLWTASVGATLAAPNLAPYTAAAAIVPLLFLFVEVSYRRIQRRFIWRSERIGEFINDGRFASGVSRGDLGASFRLWDPSGVYTADPSYRRFIGVRTVMRFQSIRFFYGGLALLSLTVGILRILVS